MITEPKLENRSDQHYVAIRTQVSMQELGTGVIPQLHREVFAWLGKQGLAPSGAPFIRYLVINMMEKLDIELGWPIARALSGTDRICAGVLPAGRYASLVYIGPYEGDGLIKANAALLDWGAAHGIAWDTGKTSMATGSARVWSPTSKTRATSQIQPNGKRRWPFGSRIIALSSRGSPGQRVVS